MIQLMHTGWFIAVIGVWRKAQRSVYEKRTHPKIYMGRERDDVIFKPFRSPFFFFWGGVLFFDIFCIFSKHIEI